MMSSGHKGVHALKHNILNWQWKRESSLNQELLIDVAPEIELSDYRRLPSSRSESPSDLLNGEGLNVEPIADLDLFFDRLYKYYCENGLQCIIIKWVVELLSLGFTICFSGVFLLFVDWNGLRNAKCGIEAVESGIKPCDLAKEAFHQHPLTPFTFTKGVILGYLGIFSGYWIFTFVRFCYQLKDILEIRRFYYNSLQVTDREVQTMPWATILEKVVQIQRSQQLCVVKDLSAHDIIMRIMRKENYLIGMLNKGILAFPISQWVPGSGPAVSSAESGIRGRRNCLMLPKTLEWTFNWCILQSMFDRNFRLQSDFISNPTSLRRRLMLIGIAMLLLSPFSIIFMVVFHFLRHAEQFYNHPSIASSRRWSNLSRWIFREFNEVDHLFKHRMNSSVIHADEYLKQFPSPIISIIAKFVSFVSGGFAAILIIIAILDESLLEGHIYGRNLLWYAAVFGTVTAISRAAIMEDLQVRNPEGAMSLVVQHTHHMPKRWRGKENSDVVRTEFETLFQYTGMMLLEEMASIFLTPFLLIFVVPQRVEDILQFISNFTVDVEGVGHVCSLSVFDFERHGNSNYGAPYNTPQTQRSSQGKLEKSFLSFHSSYPTWEPDAAGKQFLSTLRSFRDQNLPGRTRQEFRYPRNWQLNLNLRNQGNMGGIPITGYQLGSLWIVDSDQNSHPYLLDWYYTSRFPHTLNDSEDIPPPTEMERDRDIWRPNNQAGTQAGPRFEQNWGFHLDEERARTPMEPSTSTPSFRESVLQQHNTGHLERPVENHWWARNDHNSGGGTQASFLEPPVFNHQMLENIHENYSDRSSEEQEQRLDWRNSQLLCRTTCIEEDVAGADEDFNLPFNDIYYTPSEETKMKSQHQNHETVNDKN
ncbi:autophagy-related protein 9-like [Papaver somniferum]|uniref:autophagy-related protein 9-like n=1 Tax=Papaver somniferum TaxID=3469 RepID=UPI000E6F7724|nr:autophagy-related protein 9-like [Papaver somniferum]XP_026407148.1 autophagy-related protein 9-like [Papaver somniferum]